MRKIGLRILAGVALAGLLMLGTSTATLAQGRGGGRPAGPPGGGRPAGPPPGNPGVGGRPTGAPGVDRGLGTASERSGGRSDEGLGTASTRSGGRSDDGLARARMARENSQRADNELRRHPRMAERLNTTPEELRAGYQEALAVNPELRFGQYVAAQRLARKLGARHTNVTTEAILSGLAQGKSLGRTLQDLGVSSQEAREAQRRAEREIRESRQRQ